MIPMPTQISGAQFLAARRRAFLWDQARVGKTGAAIIAADYILARTILVVTTASGRGVWRKAFPAWSALGRTVKVLGVDAAKQQTEVGIVSWGSLHHLPAAISKRPDLIILDEDQKAVSPEAERTQHIYGRPIEDGLRMLTDAAIVRPADRVWHLSGNPVPHDLSNGWARMRASCPERLQADARKDWPDVTRFWDFAKRYTTYRMKQLPNFQSVPVFFGGKNEIELRARLDGMFLRRTQADVGIRPPSYELLPLVVSEKVRREANGDVDQGKVLGAMERGETRELEMHLGTLRRVHGMIKAKLVADAAREEFDSGLEKLVIAYWHKDVGDYLEQAMRRFGVIRLDGSTSAKAREGCEAAFRQKSKRVFLAQLVAASEAIDLSPSNELWFCETSFSPLHFDQMSKRITNVAQTRNTFVRVCAIEGSIDEMLQECVRRLWAPIRQVVN